MLDYSHGEIGWDAFTLEYKVDAPIDTVLDPESMIKYLKLFNHLWQMKRIEGSLNKGWMRMAGLLVYPQQGRELCHRRPRSRVCDVFCNLV